MVKSLHQSTIRGHRIFRATSHPAMEGLGNSCCRTLSPQFTLPAIFLWEHDSQRFFRPALWKQNMVSCCLK